MSFSNRFIQGEDVVQAYKQLTNAWRNKCDISVLTVCFWTYSMLIPQGNLTKYDKGHDRAFLLSVWLMTCDKFGFWTFSSLQELSMTEPKLLWLHVQPLTSRYHGCVIGSMMTVTLTPPETPLCPVFTPSESGCTSVQWYRNLQCFRIIPNSVLSSVWEA